MNGWLLRNGARFLDFPFNLNQKEPNDTAGYRQLADSKELQESDKYWVFPRVYVQDVINGFNEKQANEILLGAEMLIQGKERGHKYLNHLPKTISGGKTIRCYVLEILNEDLESEEIE